MTTPVPIPDRFRSIAGAAPLALEVAEVFNLTPGLRRIRLTGDDLRTFEYQPGQDLMIMIAANGDRTTSRRYSIRGFDRDRLLLDLDMVVHHGEGPGRRWANALQPGDKLNAVGPRGKIYLQPEASWHLFAGDESAIAVTLNMMESAPPEVLALAFLEIEGPDYQVPVPFGEDPRRSFTWLLRARGPSLVEAVSSVDLPPGSGHAYINGEVVLVSARSNTPWKPAGYRPSTSPPKPTGAAARPTKATANPRNVPSNSRGDACVLTSRSVCSDRCPGGGGSLAEEAADRRLLVDAADGFGEEGGDGDLADARLGAAAGGRGTVSVTTTSASGEARMRSDARRRSTGRGVTTARTDARAAPRRTACGHVGQAAPGEDDVVDQDGVAAAHVAQQRRHLRALVVERAHLVADGHPGADRRQAAHEVAHQRARAGVRARRSPAARCAPAAPSATISPASTGRAYRLSTGTWKKPWIWPACRSIGQHAPRPGHLRSRRPPPARGSRPAARPSCRPCRTGSTASTAVTLRALARRAASSRNSSSITWSFGSRVAGLDDEDVAAAHVLLELDLDRAVRERAQPHLADRMLERRTHGGWTKTGCDRPPMMTSRSRAGAVSRHSAVAYVCGLVPRTRYEYRYQITRHGHE